MVSDNEVCAMTTSTTTSCLNNLCVTLEVYEAFILAEEEAAAASAASSSIALTFSALLIAVLVLIA